jgi:DNA-directed RNA polymerase subunit E'/Rpb7
MDHTALFEEQVPLTPKDLRNEIKSIDSLLEQKLQAKLEGRCSRHGYVLPGSIQILSRSMGIVEKGRFTGSVLFHVQAEGQVLNPPDGLVLEGEVVRKNKMGVYVNYKDAIRVIVPRDPNIGNDEFEEISVGDTIKVEVKKSRFQVNDEYILSVGLFKGRVRGAAPAMQEEAEEGAAAAAAVAALEGQEEVPEEEEAVASEEQEEAEAVDAGANVLAADEAPGGSAEEGEMEGEA